MKLFGGLVALTLATGGCFGTISTKNFTPYTVTVEYQGTETTTRYEGEDQKIIYQQPDKPKTKNHQAILADLVLDNKLYYLR